MKLLLFLALMLSFTAIQAQNAYYTTDGTNRMTFDEVEDIRVGLKEKMTKAMGKPMYVSLVVEETINIEDSIIHKVMIDATDKKQEENIKAKNDFGIIGKPLTNFELKDLVGNTLTVEDLKGKPTLLNFWFTGCAPCIEEMPVLNNIANQFEGKVNFVAITFESSSRVNRFLERREFNFLHLTDAQDYINELGFNEFPKNIFLNEKGEVILIESGIPYQTSENGRMEIGDGNEFITKLNDMLSNE